MKNVNLLETKNKKKKKKNKKKKKKKKHLKDTMNPRKCNQIKCYHW